MLFKCHKVFHLDYNPAFVKMMHFIDYYVFENTEDDEIDITTTMREIATKMNTSELNEPAARKN